MFDGAAEGYWHYLANPSAMDNELEYTFYGAVGVAAVSDGTAAALAWGPSLLAASTKLPIPTFTVGPAELLAGKGGTLIVGGIGIQATTGTLGVTGSRVLTAAGLLSAPLFLKPMHDPVKRL